MARLSAPCFSLSARGRLGDGVVFSRWKGINTLRRKSEPAKRRTSSQKKQRDTFRRAAVEWNSLDFNALDRRGWDLFGDTLRNKRPGYNAWTKHVSMVINAGQELKVIHLFPAEVQPL